MRKLLYTLAGLGALAMMASCNKEAESPVAAGDGLTATFTVVAPEGVSTKAIGEGSLINSLAFAAYDEAGNYLADLSTRATITGDASPWTVTVPVIKDMTYKFVFYAKSTENNGYSVFDPSAKTIKLDYTKLAANDDKADFFYAYDSFQVESSFTKTETLTRPLAQVNFGASDLTKAAYSIKTDETLLTGVSLTGINNVMNVLDQTLSGAAAIELSKAARVDDASQFVTGYDRVAMVYVLAGASQTSNVTLNVSAQGAQNSTAHTITRNVANVPLQANYRTNILGNLFTNDYEFTVYTEPGFAEPDFNVIPETVTGIEALNRQMGEDMNKTGNQNYEIAEADGQDIEIPSGMQAASLAFTIDKLADSVTTITIKDANNSVSSYAHDIYIQIPSDVDPESITVNTPSAHVVITKEGTIRKVIAATGDNTLVIPSGTTVAEIEVSKGNISIEKGATVTDISNTGAATIYVFMDEAGSWTNMQEQATANLIPFIGIKLDATGVYHILSADGLKNFRDMVNSGKNTFAGKTLELDADIDLNNEAWEPIGNQGDFNGFQGIFDGKMHTISRLYVNVEGNKAGGLFGNDNGNFTIRNLVIEGAEVHTLTSHGASGCAIVLGANQNANAAIENVTVRNAKSYGNRRVAIIAGYFKGSIKNCVVENVEVVATVDELKGLGQYDNGDKAGILLGYANGQCTLTNNSIDGFSITGYRHLGSLAGYADDCSLVSGNKVKNGTITAFSEHIDVDNNKIGDGIDTLIGKHSGTIDASNTYENVSVGILVAKGVSFDGVNTYTVDGEKTTDASLKQAIADSAARGLTDPVFKIEGQVSLDTEMVGNQYATFGNASTNTLSFIGQEETNAKISCKSTYRDYIQMANADGKFIFKDLIFDAPCITSGTWDSYDLQIRNANVEFDNVVIEKAIALSNPGKKSVFNNVTINETTDCYALWICSGGDVEMSGCTVNAPSGRAIKIADQYQDPKDLVKLSVSASIFISAKKAAVLVSNAGGAKIIWGEGNDISRVAADNENAVWNDEDWEDYYNLVEVSGCTKKQEQ